MWTCCFRPNICQHPEFKQHNQQDEMLAAPFCKPLTRLGLQTIFTFQPNVSDHNQATCWCVEAQTAGGCCSCRTSPVTLTLTLKSTQIIRAALSQHWKFNIKRFQHICGFAETHLANIHSVDCVQCKYFTKNMSYNKCQKSVHLVSICAKRAI